MNLGNLEQVASIGVLLASDMVCMQRNQTLHCSPSDSDACVLGWTMQLLWPGSYLSVCETLSLNERPGLL